MGRIGKKFEFTPCVGQGKVMGTVIYVHPKGRYIVLAYRKKTPFGLSPVLRESLKLSSDMRVMS